MHHEPVAFIILHDQDSNDCIKLKNQLIERCQSRANFPFLIRIVCHELESWYLGNLDAIESAYPSFKANRFKNKPRFRNPDLLYASDVLSKILPGFQKRSAATAISQHLDFERNRSTSFKNFISGLQNLIATSV